jgi:CubicO group peptidase (beta-lactamase class C family)
MMEKGFLPRPGWERTMMPFAFDTVTATQAGFSAEKLAELDSYFNALVSSGQLPGHVLLLIRGNSIVHGHVTGYADWTAKTHLHADSIFPLFSMTKPLTAAAMMLLYDDGKWQLDDPVSRYLPEFAAIADLPGSRATRGPTIWETFTHTAGFSFGPTRDDMLNKMDQIAWHKAGSLDELLRRYASMPLDYEPGTSWEYSVATDLQAGIVERLTGERFDLFLKRRLFDPLGMADSGFALDYDQNRRLAACHHVDTLTGRLRRATDDEKMESTFPMGGTSFKSTAVDFAIFCRMLLNRGQLGDTRLLEPATVDLMLANHLPDHLLEQGFQTAQYRIGVGQGHAFNGIVCMDPERVGRPVGKGTYEWGGAYGAWFWIDPEHDIICIGMTHRRRIVADLRPLEVVAQEIVYRALHSG